MNSEVLVECRKLLTSGTLIKEFIKKKVFKLNRNSVIFKRYFYATPLEKAFSES